MKTRSHIHEESFDVTLDQMFKLLVTPSAIREWWGASRVIVMAREGGVWTAAWGDEDDPDYISTATLIEYDPPRKLVMKYGEYYAKSGSLPFKFADDAVTRFTIEPAGSGCTLRVEQTGFPCDPVADDFYAACETGWKNTFEGIRNFLNKSTTDTAQHA
ncbi:MAG TPA: SRPBCC domain-containing protein [Pyrinomonadaceae bacterium]